MNSSASSIAPSDSISEVVSEVVSEVSDATTTTRSSWVWKYFVTELVDQEMKNVCKAMKGFIDTVRDDNSPVGDVCGTPFAIDKNGSTKSMSRHLDRSHHILKPVQTNQPTVAAFYIDGEPIKVSFFYNYLFKLSSFSYIFSFVFSFHFLYLFSIIRSSRSTEPTSRRS
jgi:hypothetical protein